MFRNADFGPNATIVVGDSNIQKPKNEMISNHFDALAKVLRARNIDESDVLVFKTAIKSDTGSPEHASNDLGQNVRNWFASMMQKSAEVTLGC